MLRVDPRVRRRLIAASVALVLLVSAASMAYSVATKRRAAMAAAASAARAALRAARAEDAMTWAPDQLRTAERASADALTQQRVQETRLWPIPASDEVVAAWAAAEQSATRASTSAHDRRQAAAADADQRINEARAAVAWSGALADSIHLGPKRRILAQAKQALGEAEVYRNAGALVEARDRAREAADLATQVRELAADIAQRYGDAGNIARWQRWQRETIEWSRREGRAAIVVVKDTHTMTLYARGEAVRRYTVELGFNWIVDKTQEGDGATPEGRYRVVTRMDHLSSEYYKALLLDYPNAEDRAEFSRLRRRGDLPPGARIGGLIEIHGSGGRRQDWTNGCVAVTNADMDEIFPRVTVGTPVTIIGSDSYGPIAEFADGQKRDAGIRRP
jgi:hypothetical protein